MSGYLVLSPTDKVILESYKILVDGLSAYLGEGYEIILHSLEIWTILLSRSSTVTTPSGVKALPSPISL